MTAAADPFQARFERRWGHLTRPHVRALAWLLDAPDLLAADAAVWSGRIATLGPVTPGVADWLAGLEADPAPLDAALGERIYSRLGLYAEKLLAFYFARQGVLIAHGLQVRASRNDTVGEFDFLLRSGAALLHWEFASKFYLLDGDADLAPAHRLVGPNLADTLGAKIDKILDKQLALARHPAAQSLLPQPVDGAQALVKGWLFYPDGVAPPLAGIAPAHCHGFWCALGQLPALAARRYAIMPRMQWLAPLKAPADTPTFAPHALHAALAERFAADPSALMVAAVRARGDWLVETARGFVVPDDWGARAAARRAAGSLPS